MNVGGLNSGVALATTRDNQRTDSDVQRSLPVSVVGLAIRALADANLEPFLMSAPRVKTSGSQMPGIEPQALTARTRSLLSDNNYYVKALASLWENTEFKSCFDALRSSDQVLAEDIETSLNKIQKYLAPDPVQDPLVNDESRIDQSQGALPKEIARLTKMLAKNAAFACKTVLFEKVLSLAGQPTMQLIDIATQLPERPDWYDRLKTGLEKAGFLNDATQAIALPELTSRKHRTRNTLLMLLTPVNADEGTVLPKPLRLFFISGALPMPDSLFSSQTAHNDNTIPKVMDLCEGGANSGTRAGMLNAKFKKPNEGIKWLTDKINEARNSEQVLAVDSTVLEKLGIGLQGHQKDVPTVSDSPQKEGETTNSRDHDTEHMAVSFLLRMGEKLGLNATGKDNKPVRYTLDLLSRRPVCRSCHLGLSLAVTNKDFPRLTEFNVVYGSSPEPNPQKQNS